MTDDDFTCCWRFPSRTYPRTLRRFSRSARITLIFIRKKNSSEINFGAISKEQTAHSCMIFSWMRNEKKENEDDGVSNSR